MMRFNVKKNNTLLLDGVIFENNQPSSVTAGNWQIDNVDPNAQYVFCDAVARNCFAMQGENLFDGMMIDLSVESDKRKTGALVLSSILVLSMLRKKKKAVGEITGAQAKTGLYIGLGVLGIMFAKKFLSLFGIIDSKETQTLNDAAVNPNSFWSPNFYKQFSVYSFALTTAQAAELARKLYNSFGIFNDCEECAKSVFFGLKTKANVSFLAKVFSDEYGQDLLSFLRGGYWPQDRLSDSDVYEINQYISKLPNS